MGSGLYRHSWTSLPKPFVSAQQLSERIVVTEGETAVLKCMDMRGQNPKSKFMNIETILHSCAVLTLCGPVIFFSKLFTDH
jgi:hypothetical protein